MILPVLAAVLTVALRCYAADDNAPVLDQLEDLISENILDELAEEDNGEVAAAVRYMIPVPIRVVVPVPQQQPIQQPIRDRETEFEREPIVAVPIGATPGRYGPTWRPIGPPVIAVPVGSASSPYPYGSDPYRGGPARYNSPRGGSRRTRSVDEEELQAEQHDQGELTSNMTPKEVPAKGIHSIDNPLKVSSKMRKGVKSDKWYRPKRQVGYYGYVRSGYNRPARVIVAPQPGQIVVAQPGQVVMSPVPGTPVVPVPVYVPVPMDTASTM